MGDAANGDSVRSHLPAAGDRRTRAFRTREDSRGRTRASRGAFAFARGERHALGLGRVMRSPREDDADALARHLGTGLHHHGSRSELAPAEKGRHKRVRALAVVLALGLLRAAQVSYARADETTRALVHLFYQAPAILIAAVWLWGANLFLWRRLRFDPHPLAVFQLEDARAHLTHARVWGVARASSLDASSRMFDSTSSPLASIHIDRSTGVSFASLRSSRSRAAASAC